MAASEEPPVTPLVARAVQAAVNILLVDDEVRNLDVLESVLQCPEHNLVRALTAERALSALLDGEFAVIVLDIQMPEMSGIELASLIKQRKRTAHIPIIFLTAYFQEDKDILEGYGTGAVDYLTKPINSQILKSKIAVFVDLFRKTRALGVTNRALEQEISHREKAEEALKRINNDLEARVRERTADLTLLNEELSLARDRALAASRAKDDFLARLSHELRTPLNPVLLLASDAATNTELSEEVRANFEMIAENVALEARLIDDLLDLTRIARGKLVLDVKPFAFNAVLKDALAMVRPDLDEKGLRLELKIEENVPPIMGDEIRVKQVLWNVIKNAVKFTATGGMVTIETNSCRRPGRFEVRVIDTGIGMTSDEIARIFEAFAQGDHAAGGSHRFGGLGLGLAISRMLVELHGGAITAVSPGRNLGTEFLIDLPVNGAAHPAAAAT